jgi:hypothetical protein
MVLHELVHGIVVEVLPGEDEVLPDLIEGSIREVLGGKGRTINESKAWITLADTVPFNELHQWPPIP